MQQKGELKMKYDVHAFAVVRRKFTDVEANSQIEAIGKAVDANYEDFHLDFRLDDNTEFAEEFSHYCVDEHRDDGFTRSTWYDADLEYCSGWRQVMTLYDEPQLEFEYSIKSQYRMRKT